MMEQQIVDETKPKISRSAARHLRRKKLIAARKEAEKNPLSELENSNKNQSSFSKQENTSSLNFKTLNSTSIQKVDPDNVKNKNVNINTASKEISDLLKSKNNVVINESIQKNDSFPGLCTITNKSNSIEKSRTITKSTDKSESVVDNSSFNSIISTGENSLINKMNPQEKSREQIKAEREAKKAAKAAAKGKGKVKNDVENVPSAQLNKIEKLETKDKSKTTPNNLNTESVSSGLPFSKKQTIAQNAVEKNKTESKIQDDKAVQDKPKTEEKSKAELRAERRAKQEAQRAAKQASVNEIKKPVKKANEKISSQDKPTESVSKEEPVKKIIAKSEIKDNAHEVNLFKHLYINRKNISLQINQSNLKIHPAILRLGVQYAEKVIVGSNARCVALLAAVKQLIQDYERPSQADFTRGLEASLQESVNYLNFCRPSAVSMQNALKHLKWQMSTLPATVPDAEAKSKLANAIDTYIQEQILLADKAISNAIQKKISKGDVILTYGFSSLIHKILCDAHTAGKEFRVIVVDGRPWLEGKELLRRLVKHGIDCSYILINALSYIMPQVSKVFLGAHAILANGAVMSRAGTAQVALIAKAFNVPVLVACETHKSCERVQTDSIVYNEIGNPDELLKNQFNNSKKSCLSNWKNKKSLNLLNITYDVTPADLVTAVVTELAILPCTSVPVILRIKPSEI